MQASHEDLIRAAAEHRAIVTDYPYHLRVRPFAESAGGRRIQSLLDSADEDIGEWLALIRHYLPVFRTIQYSGQSDGVDPFWNNGMFPGLDGMLLYTMIRELHPKTYLEVGSGNSTKFVRKAIVDGGLSTRVVSIDPHPRAAIDQLCDHVIRQPFEDVPAEVYLDFLQAGDIVYIDNSHMSLPNSDVTVFFTEMLPALPPSIVYGIHDIFLPLDYPASFQERFYNEQYLLVSYLLGGADGDDVMFPGIHASMRMAAINDIFSGPEFAGVERHAGAFWMRRAAARP